MVSGKPLTNQAATTGGGDPLLSGCVYCLDQCDFVLATVSAEDYRQRSGEGASVGAHMRHILDRYQCYLAGLADDRIDYDARQRDPAIETRVDAARFALGSLRRRLDEAWREADRSRIIQVCERVDRTTPPPSVASTPAREMLALVSHSIHHLAIIVLLLQAQGYSLPPDLGKAPSTIVFEQG